MTSNVLWATFAILHKNNKQERKNILKMNKEVYRDAAAIKRANTSGVGKSNYYEDIYMPPYNNTH